MSLQNHVRILEQYLPIEIELKKKLKDVRKAMKESKSYIENHLQSNQLGSIIINDVIIKLKKNKSFNLSTKQLHQTKIDDQQKKSILKKFTKETTSLQY
tara:strand:+ start:214 stop:510 length:297 start_codon:yes stop_codon:yes gene_type:complete